MTTDGGIPALHHIRPNTWVRIAGDYYHYKGPAPDGTHRAQPYYTMSHDLVLAPAA